MFCDGCFRRRPCDNSLGTRASQLASDTPTYTNVTVLDGKLEKQRGVSLFVVLLVIVSIAGVTLLGWPWYKNRTDLCRAEKVEANAMSGIAPSRSPDESRIPAAARERAEKLETS